MPNGTDALEHARKLAEIERPNWQRVFVSLCQSYEEGNIEAGYALATWYLHGRHVEKDIKKAIHLLKESATANHPSGVYDLAICYEKGHGVRKSASKAVGLYLRAAILGETCAFYEVGRCYYHGIGVQRDRKIARIWLDHMILQSEGNS